MVFLFGVLLVRSTWGFWGFLGNILTGETKIIAGLALFIICALMIFLVPLRVIRGEE